MGRGASRALFHCLSYLVILLLFHPIQSFFSRRETYIIAPLAAALDNFTDIPSYNDFTIFQGSINFSNTIIPKFLNFHFNDPLFLGFYRSVDF